MITSPERLLGLGLPKKLLPLLKRLNTPQKIQEYLRALHYNHEETHRSFVGVASTLEADCFEGATFAYILLYLHGYDPKVVMIQAENDVDHLVVTYKQNDSFGAVAMSRDHELTDRPPIFNTLHNLIMSYYPYYTSIYPEYAGQLTMVGFSDPVDLVVRFGVRWFFLNGDNALKYLYSRVAENVMCTHIFTGKRYLYPPEE